LTDGLGQPSLLVSSLERTAIVRLDNGSYAQIRYPQDEVLADYPVVYRGGYNHIVDDATKASLIAGNVGVTEANFTAL